MMERRLTELEIRYSYHDRQIEELSQIVYEHQRTIDRLLARLEQAERRLAEIFQAVGPSPPPERPPHY